jgi:SAM-dependent methyltransferase
MQVATDIPGHDPMYEYAPELYLKLGEQGLRVCQQFVSEPKRILDYACGYGRVLRWLRAGYPDAEIVAADIFKPMPAFCQRALGADEGILVPKDPTDLDLGTFDLIWVGSLLSHSNAEAWERFLAYFSRSLDGTLVFTTPGPSFAESLRTRADISRFTEDQVVQVLRDYDETGFGYWPTITEDHGDCVCSSKWVERRVEEARMRVVERLDAGWAGQDVYACLLA